MKIISKRRLSQSVSKGSELQSMTQWSSFVAIMKSMIFPLDSNNAADLSQMLL